MKHKTKWTAPRNNTLNMPEVVAGSRSRSPDNVMAGLQYQDGRCEESSSQAEV